MARRIYSLQFYAVQGLSGAGADITVPFGHVYVVKQLTFYSSPLVATVHGFFEDRLSGATLFHGSAAPLGNTWEGFYGALVFEAGQSFRWRIGASAFDAADVSVSGYDLINT